MVVVEEVLLHERRDDVAGLEELNEAVRNNTIKNPCFIECSRHLFVTFNSPRTHLVSFDMAVKANVLDLIQHHTTQFILHNIPIPAEINALGIEFECAIVLVDYWHDHLLLVLENGECILIPWCSRQQRWIKNESTWERSRLCKVGVVIKHCTLTDSSIVWVQQLSPSENGDRVASESDNEHDLMKQSTNMERRNSSLSIYGTGDADNKQKIAIKLLKYVKNPAWKDNQSCSEFQPFGFVEFGDTQVIITSIPCNYTIKLVASQWLVILHVMPQSMEHSPWLLLWSARRQMLEVWVANVGASPVSPMGNVNVMAGVVPCFSFSTISHTVMLTMATSAVDGHPAHILAFTPLSDECGVVVATSTLDVITLMHTRVEVAFAGVGIVEEVDRYTLTPFSSNPLLATRPRLILWANYLGLLCDKNLHVYSHVSPECIQTITTDSPPVLFEHGGSGNMIAWLVPGQGCFMLLLSHYTEQIKTISQIAGEDVGVWFGESVGKEVLAAQLLFAKLVTMGVEGNATLSIAQKSELFSFLLSQLETPAFLVSAVGHIPSNIAHTQASLHNFFKGKVDGHHIEENKEELQTLAHRVFSSLGSFSQDANRTLEQYADDVDALFDMFMSSQPQPSDGSVLGPPHFLHAIHATIAELLAQSEGVRGAIAPNDYARSFFERYTIAHPHEALDEIFKYFNVKLDGTSEKVEMKNIRTEAAYTLAQEIFDSTFIHSQEESAEIGIFSKRQLQHSLFEHTVRMLHTHKPSLLIPFIRSVTDVIVTEVQQRSSSTPKDYEAMYSRAVDCLAPVFVLEKRPNEAICEQTNVHAQILILLHRTNNACDIFLRQCMWLEVIDLLREQKLPIPHLYTNTIERMSKCGVLHTYLKDIWMSCNNVVETHHLLRLIHSSIPLNTRQPFTSTKGSDTAITVGMLRDLIDMSDEGMWLIGKKCREDDDENGNKDGPEDHHGDEKDDGKGKPSPATKKIDGGDEEDKSDDCDGFELIQLSELEG
eukprot:m.14710 g.14710  ORF g.14710 m.14710 type:complete len:996 (+) comp4357_c0_seq1:59-3046(+)